MSEQYTSENINEIAAALSKFQGAAPTIEKTKSVNIKAKAGYMIKYNYADIADVMEAIRKPLSDNGLFVSSSIQITREGRNLVTTVFHSSGQWLRCVMILEPTADEKAIGGKITYYRRYSIGSLLGLVTDDDVDCDGQGGQMVEAKRKEAPQAKKAVPKPIPLPTAEMLAFCDENKGTPCFTGFITYIAKKTNRTEFEIIRQAEQRRETFLKSVEAFAKSEDEKKAPDSKENQKPKESKKKTELRK